MLSMQILFPTCVEVLTDALEPLHYSELTNRALTQLGLKPNGQDFLRLKEDVREKLLLKGAYGTAYIGKPFYVGVLRRWFQTDQLPLLNGEWEGLRIRGNATAGYYAAFELIKRRQFMLTKHMESPARDQGAAFGKIIEEHVSLWARDRWPMFWRPPVNAGQWDQPCPHDFRLRLPHGMIEVDVMGPLRRGAHGLIFDVTEKRTTDIHLCASISRADVVLHGFMPQRYLKDTWEAHETLPISWFVVWLNCEHLKYPYAEFRRRMK